MVILHGHLCIQWMEMSRSRTKHSGLSVMTSLESRCLLNAWEEPAVLWRDKCPTWWFGVVFYCCFLCLTFWICNQPSLLPLDSYF